MKSAILTMFAGIAGIAGVSAGIVMLALYAASQTRETSEGEREAAHAATDIGVEP